MFFDSRLDLNKQKKWNIPVCRMNMNERTQKVPGNPSVDLDLEFEENSMTPQSDIATHVFAIHELLLLILSYFSPPGKGTISAIDTASLASLARVSRNISDAAIDGLWRSMYRPDAIIRLLPADSYEIESADKNGKYRLRRPLTSHDFAAFDKYASRIRFVDFSNSSRILVRGCEIFPYIKEFRDPVLPSLEVFRWEPSVVNGSIGAFHLLSREASLPREEFTLLMWAEIEHTPNETDAIARTIDAFNDPTLPWLPDVRKLTLRTLHYLPAVMTAVQKLESLEYLSCDLCVDAPLFERLASIPCLRFIDLRHLPSESTRSVSANSPSFPALETLRISGTISSIYAFLPHISSPNLLSVRLLPQENLQSIDSALFSLLLSPTLPARTSTLTHFTFAGRTSLSEATRLRLVLAAFAPLYACRALQTFCVDTDPMQLVFRDADVHAMAAAWPNLVVLSITPPRTGRLPVTPDVRLYTLSALASGCPHLSQLALEVDAEVIQPFRAEAEGGSLAIMGAQARPPMKSLMLFCSPCGDPALVADFLRVAFPNLSAQEFHAYSTPFRPVDKQKWAAVTAALG
ncbi:hypothetical protein GGX14DRAFT_543474 [Mycena pura]|uniref:F-box domain-containing protein n=1 Tax=Mycena pura TaxID=153505 RepID=A0AAD6VEX9_9AGAR|nr:hypothetical protein GGX14DRAFT_543474 [Mycena pura]